VRRHRAGTDVRVVNVTKDREACAGRTKRPQRRSRKKLMSGGGSDGRSQVSLLGDSIAKVERRGVSISM